MLTRADPSPSLYRWTQTVYALHALSPAIAMLGAVPGVGRFLIESFGSAVFALRARRQRYVAAAR